MSNTINTIKALNQALAWVRDEWIGRQPEWTGEIDDLVSACVHESGLTVKEVKEVWEAITDGEYIDTEGWYLNGEQVTVLSENTKKNQLFT